MRVITKIVIPLFGFSAAASKIDPYDDCPCAQKYSSKVMADDKNTKQMNSSKEISTEPSNFANLNLQNTNKHRMNEALSTHLLHHTDNELFSQLDKESQDYVRLHPEKFKKLYDLDKITNPNQNTINYKMGLNTDKIPIDDFDLQSQNEIFRKREENLLQESDFEKLLEKNDENYNKSHKKFLLKSKENRLRNKWLKKLFGVEKRSGWMDQEIENYNRMQSQLLASKFAPNSFNNGNNFQPQRSRSALAGTTIKNNHMVRCYYEEPLTRTKRKLSSDNVKFNLFDFGAFKNLMVNNGQNFGDDDVWDKLKSTVSHK